MVPLHGQVSALLQGVDCMSAMLLTRSWSRMEVTPHPRRGKTCPVMNFTYFSADARRPGKHATKDSNFSADEAGVRHSCCRRLEGGWNHLLRLQETCNSREDGIRHRFREKQSQKKIYIYI